jgi:DNA-binding NarL/FixJ family response regulator
VLAAFVGPYPVGAEIRHLNGTPNDNRLKNLEYSTRSRNGQDKKWHRGQSTYRLSPEEVAVIKRRLRDGVTGASIARNYGIAQSTVSAIRHGKFHNDILSY